MLIIPMALVEAERQDKFMQLYARYHRLMLYRAYRILGNKEDAEDAVQEALLAIARHFYKISDVESPKTRAFVVIIVERKSIDLLRRRREGLPLADAALLPAPNEPMHSLSPLAEAITALPTRDRQLLTLRAVCGLSPAETARLLGMKLTAVYKAEQRAKKRLRELLNKYQEDCT